VSLIALTAGALAIGGEKPGDELWSFSSSTESWQQFAGRMGVALLRDGKAIEVIITEMN